MPVEGSAGRRAWRRFALVVMLIAGLVAVVPAAPAGASYRDRQRELQREIAQKQAAIADAQRRERGLMALIAESDARRDQLTQQLLSLQSKLQAARDDLAVLEGRLEALSAVLDVKNAQLEQTLALLQDKLKIFNDRVADIYIDAPTGYGRALAAAQSFDDLIVVSEYTTGIVRADMNLVASIERTRDSIAAQRDDIQTKTEQLAEDRAAAAGAAERIALAKAQRAQARAAVQAEIDRKNVLLSRVRDEKQAYIRALRQLQAESQSIEAFLRGRQRGQRVIKGVGGYLRWPISGRITSGYGRRTHPIYRYRSFHTGIDISSPTGTPIGAARSGTVLATGFRRAYGLIVIIDHGNSLATVYAHLSRVYVRPGNRVRTGQSIGAVGSTGWATGPHLHFEVRSAGAPQHPLGWL